MEERERKAIAIAGLIWRDIERGTHPAVLQSWNVSDPCATRIPWYFDRNHRPTLEMPAIKVAVKGFCFQGNVYVAYDAQANAFHVFASTPEIGFVHPVDGAPMSEIPSLLDKLISQNSPMDGEKNHCLQAN